MALKITVFGTGYVGLVTGACLSEIGHTVVCVDTDAEKIAMLSEGKIFTYEPGLEEIVKRNQRESRLRFTTDAADGVQHGEIQFIAVGTPQAADGSADLRFVDAVAKTIATYMADPKIVVNKSTVPVGTADRVDGLIAAELAKREVQVEYQVCSNPEFLKEGAAVEDFMKPDRIVVGTNSAVVEATMTQLYAPLARQRSKLLFMDLRSAELTKYAANAMLAAKISFMNEIANIAELAGADVESIRKGIGSDSRIGYSFIYPGCGYGGSCFPKDVNALAETASGFGYQSKLLRAIDDINEFQKTTLFTKLSKQFDGDLRGKTIALWGLAFKPNTSDMREAPSRVLMESLWAAGAMVQAYDPEAMAECRHIYGDRADLVLANRQYDALDGADALVVCTEWSAFRSPDFDVIRSRLKAPVIVDGRNLWEPSAMREMGFRYHSVGRQAV